MLSTEYSTHNEEWEKTVDKLNVYLNIGKLQPKDSGVDGLFFWVSPEEKKQGGLGKMMKRKTEKKRYEIDANEKVIRVYQNSKDPKVQINIQDIHFLEKDTLHPSVQQKALKKNPGKYIVLETVKGKLYGFPVLEEGGRKLLDDLKRAYGMAYDKSKAQLNQSEDHMDHEERKLWIRENIDSVADDIFVDDTECLWTVLGLKHVGNMTYVQMSTKSTKVSFNQVRILLQGHADNSMSFLACYVFEDGVWKHFCGTDPLVEDDMEYDGSPAGQADSASTSRKKATPQSRRSKIVREKS